MGHGGHHIWELNVRRDGDMSQLGSGRMRPAAAADTGTLSGVPKRDGDAGAVPPPSPPGRSPWGNRGDKSQPGPCPSPRPGGWPGAGTAAPKRWPTAAPTAAGGGILGQEKGSGGRVGGLGSIPPPPSPGAHLEASHGPALQVGLHVARVQVGDAHQEAGPRESPELPQAETGLGMGTPPPSQLKPVAPSSQEPPRRLPLTVPTQSRSPAPLSQPHPFPFSLPRPWRAAGGAPRPLPVPQFPPH